MKKSHYCCPDEKKELDSHNNNNNDDDDDDNDPQTVTTPRSNNYKTKKATRRPEQERPRRRVSSNFLVIAMKSLVRSTTTSTSTMPPSPYSIHHTRIEKDPTSPPSFVEPAREIPGGYAHVVWEHGEQQQQEEQEEKDWKMASCSGNSTTTTESVDDEDESAISEITTPSTLTGTTRPDKNNNNHHNNDNPGEDRSCSCSRSRSVRRPRIYLGSAQAALKQYTPLEVLQKAGIGAIVNCTKHLPCSHRDNNNHQYSNEDNDNENDEQNDNENNNENQPHPDSIKYAQMSIHDTIGADLLTYLPSMTAFLHVCLTYYHVSVLVHCQVGVSRSASLVLAYLMEYENMSLPQAFRLVKQRRPQIQPNPGFWAQLASYETMLRLRNNKKTNENPRRRREPFWQPTNNNRCPDNDNLCSTFVIADVWNNKKFLMSSRSSSSRNLAEEQGNMINVDWMKQSTALYAACRDLDLPGGADTLNHACFGKLVDACVEFYHDSRMADDENHNNKKEEENDLVSTDHSDKPFAVRQKQEPRKQQQQKQQPPEGRFLVLWLLDEILTVTLDYVWGRGVLLVECEWLARLCRCLDEITIPCHHPNDDNDQDHYGDGRGHVSLVPLFQSQAKTTATNRVEQLLADPESQFCAQWTGEIYPQQLGRFLTVLVQERRTTNSNTNNTKQPNSSSTAAAVENNSNNKKKHVQRIGLKINKI